MTAKAQATKAQDIINDTLKKAATVECDFERADREAKERAAKANHLMATRREQRYAAEELRALLADYADKRPAMMPNLACSLGSGQHSGEVEALRHRMVEVVLQSINFHRHGHAEGSLAQHPDGRWARRYFSSKLNRLVWLVGQPPSDNGLEVSDVDEFGTDPPESEWRVVGVRPWRVVL